MMHYLRFSQEEREQNCLLFPTKTDFSLIALLLCLKQSGTEKFSIWSFFHYLLPCLQKLPSCWNVVKDGVLCQEQRASYSTEVYLLQTRISFLAILIDGAGSSQGLWLRSLKHMGWCMKLWPDLRTPLSKFSALNLSLGSGVWHALVLVCFASEAEPLLWEFSQGPCPVSEFCPELCATGFSPPQPSAPWCSFQTSQKACLVGFYLFCPIFSF